MIKPSQPILLENDNNPQDLPILHCNDYVHCLGDYKTSCRSPTTLTSEGALVQARLSQHWPLGMVRVLHRYVIGILSLLITSDDKGVEERSEPVIPLEGVDVVEGSIPPPLVLEGVETPGDHEMEDVGDEI
ncbi:hypothetical protein Tco_1218587 [Tanacetum coccineum]